MSEPIPLIKANPPAFNAAHTLAFTCTVSLSAAQWEVMRAHYVQGGLCIEHVEHFHVVDLVRIALGVASETLMDLIAHEAPMPDLGEPIHMDGRVRDEPGTAPGFRISLLLPDGFHTPQ